MTEDEFLRQIIELAHVYQWRVHHERPAWTNKGWRTPIQGDRGFPDLVLARSPRVIIAEVKSDKGRLTREEREWLEEMEGCPGVESFIWRPRMWDDIVGILRR